MQPTRKIEIDQTGYPYERTPLDPGLFSLQDDEFLFFKEHTGITDREELREHIIRIQAEAYDKFPYPCIRRFLFTKPNISRAPEYDHVLQIGKNTAGAVMVDVGCCFGNDIRTITGHGFPTQNIVAMDLRRDFWDLGHKLFRSTPETFPVPFIEGDLFDSAILELSPPCYTAPTVAPPPLHELGNSLNALRHHVSVVHASAIFHLFPEEQQLQAARKLAALLSSRPGSIIFGFHIGLPNPGIKYSSLGGNREMFCHSPESWCTMWNGTIFRKGSVKVQAVLSDVLDTSLPATGGEAQGPDNSKRWKTTQWLRWSVIRV